MQVAYTVIRKFIGRTANSTAAGWSGPGAVAVTRQPHRSRGAVHRCDSLSNRKVMRLAAAERCRSRSFSASSSASTNTLLSSCVREK